MGSEETIEINGNFSKVEEVKKKEVRKYVPVMGLQKKKENQKTSQKQNKTNNKEFEKYHQKALIE